MLSKPGDDEEKKKDALYQELKSVNDHLEKSGKPYFGGDDICATDLSMAPKIKHIKIGADEVKVCNYPLETKVADKCGFWQVAHIEWHISVQKCFVCHIKLCKDMQ